MSNFNFNKSVLITELCKVLDVFNIILSSDAYEELIEIGDIVFNSTPTARVNPVHQTIAFISNGEKHVLDIKGYGALGRMDIKVLKSLPDCTEKLLVTYNYYATTEKETEDMSTVCRITKPTKSKFGCKVDELLAGAKFKKLIDKLSRSEDPNEAFFLITDFIGDDLLCSGKFGYGKSFMEYDFSYHKEEGLVHIGINIYNKNDKQDRIFTFELLLTKERVDTFYQSVMKLLEMFK